MRRVLALGGAALLVSSCGGHHSAGPRESVTAYITRVDAIEHRMAKQISLGAQGITFASGDAARARAYTRAERTLRQLRAQIASVPAPPQTARLRRRILALADREIALADESARLARFDPAFRKALAPLPAANLAAGTRLRATKKPAEMASALAAYRTAVERAGAALAKLRPPAVERPLYHAQVTRLAALDAALGRLIEGVRARDVLAVAKAQHAVSVASVSSDSAAAQRASRTAVLHYNALVRGIAKLAAAVATERNRLQRTLP
jgi:hypothetical protein